MKNKYNYNKKELLFYNVLLISHVSYKVRKIRQFFYYVVLYLNLNYII